MKARSKMRTTARFRALKFAYVGPDTSYLLYSGLWFPVAGYGVNRFTSTISVTVPCPHGSDRQWKKSRSPAGSSKQASEKKHASEPRSLANSKTFIFRLGKAQLPRHYHCRHFSRV